ncbi:uncharacterized protein B0T15DRAFT_490569 [Chaetomium strumarium]|uniref:Uncharacterized protein n=1 Tax=Chaetomium strumarium TaxID=1170767 RepID=A0AAJ0GY99_9PEZI|nr:hypothetical protein B0T15DRAFT_490569 [Chaetomium strumarium]
MPQTPPKFSFSRSRDHAHRPTTSSPLSSSPIRASSSSPPPLPPPQQQSTTSQPLSPCDPNALNTPLQQRGTQSSPISGPSSSLFFGSSCNSTPQTSISSGSCSSSSSNRKSRFATRNPRPNPVVKRREEAQESRRRVFLQNVRQRQDDKRWEMRGGEDELLKLEWYRLNRERLQARDAELDEYLAAMDADLVAQEEAELRRIWEQQQLQQQQQLLQQPGNADVDALMADVIAQEEEAELDALVSALQADSDGQRQSTHFSDDEDYDGLFMDLIQQQDRERICYSQDVEMT